MGRLKARTKRIDLGFMGEEWTGCFVEIRALRWEEAKRLQDLTGDNTQAVEEMVRMLQELFVSGQGIDTEGQQIALEAADMADLDLEAQTRIAREIGGSDPNDSASSEPALKPA